MQENRTSGGTVEISLMDLIWSILLRWKGIVGIMLAVGVLLAGLGAFKEYRDLANESVVRERQEAYESALETYKLNKEQLETALGNLRDDLSRQQFYKENAIMLFVDQYNVYEKTGAFYIDTNYEIAPSLYFQNPNYTSVITNSYKAALDRMDLDSVVATAAQPNLTTRNPLSDEKQMVSTTVDEGNGILNVTVKGDSEERVNLLYAAIRETLSEQEELLNQVIGEHSLGVLAEKSGIGVDTEFGTLQSEFDEKIQRITDGIESTNESLEKLKAPENETPTSKTVIWRGIKFGVIGMVLGVMLAAGITMLQLLVQDRLNSTEDIVRRYRTPVLGTLADESGLKGKLNERLAKKLGISVNKTPEEAMQYIAANVRFRLKEGRKVLLIGNCAKEKLVRLKDRMAPMLDGVDLQIGGDVNTDPSAVDALRNKAAVICVEEWQKTYHREIRHEVQAVDDSGNLNLGFVVTY